jgi:hypothetical protein
MSNPSMPMKRGRTTVLVPENQKQANLRLHIEDLHMQMEAQEAKKADAAERAAKAAKEEERRRALEDFNNACARLLNDEYILAVKEYELAEERGQEWFRQWGPASRPRNSDAQSSAVPGVSSGSASGESPASVAPAAVGQEQSLRQPPPSPSPSVADTEKWPTP